jgi:hypothetical protein
MNKTLALFPVRFNGWWLRFAFMAVALGALAVVPGSSHTTSSASLMTGCDLPDGITFAGQVTDQDITYLRDGLRVLCAHLLEWHTYVAESSPIILAVDLQVGARGVVAKSQCCDAENIGAITFGDHFGDWSISDDPEDETFQARQITFLSTLIHEMTHIRDQRAGRIRTVDVAACIEGERSAMTREAEFMDALSGAPSEDDLVSNAFYRRAIERQDSIAASEVSRASWYFYCALQHHDQD